MLTMTLEQIIQHTQDSKIRNHWPTYELNTPINFKELIEKCGFMTAIYCCQCFPDYEHLWRHFAIDCVQHLPHNDPDSRSLTVISIARLFAHDQASLDELEKARTDAYEAVFETHFTNSINSAAWTFAMAAYYTAYPSGWVAAMSVIGLTMQRSNGIETQWQIERFLQLINNEKWSLDSKP